MALFKKIFSAWPFMLDTNRLKTFRFQASGFAKVFNGGLRGQVGVRSDPEVRD